METLDPKKRRSHYAAFFIILFLLFFAVRFPLREIKIWALSKAADSAELNIWIADVSLLLPVGLELEDFLIARKDRTLVLPQINVLGIRANPFKLMGARKEAGFYVVNGGEGKGIIAIEGDSAEISIESQHIRIGGLKLENGVSLESGTISINGALTLSADYRKGKGSLDVEGKDIFLKNASPFLTELPLKEVKAKVDKNGANLTLKALVFQVEGLLFNGRGSMSLKKPAQNSSLDLSGKVELSHNGDTGPLSGMLAMIRGLTGNKNSFTVQLSGTLLRPDLKIDGKKLF